VKTALIGDVDVAIVGGGPAGSAAAIWCRRQGLRVVLLKREPFPRHRRGETLPPGVEPIFAQLGLTDAIQDAEFTRHAGTWVSWSGPRRFEPFGADERGPWRGFQAPREELDRILLDAAKLAGASVIQSCRAERPLVEDNRVVGVETSQGTILARWIVDAGSGAHWLARQLTIPLRFASPRLLARYGYATGTWPERDDAPEIAADNTGWTWTARIAAGHYHWTRLSLVEDDPHRDVAPACLAELTPLSRPRGADVTWRIVSRPAGTGYICAGDAAAVLDPASSHGVLRGLMAGIMAGHTIARVTAGAVSEPDAIAGYTVWISDLFLAEVKAMTRLYRQLPRPPRWVRDDPVASIHELPSVVPPLLPVNDEVCQR
jgi:flavin-dependent dehydrogenase